MATQKSAILFGSTGSIGGHLLRELLGSPAYAAVKTIVRRDTGIRHTKLNQLIGHNVFCRVGTTGKKTSGPDEYYRIDHDYPMAAARYSEATAFLFVSALGANPAASNFYCRMKVETKRDVIRLGFEQTHVFSPSLLMGNRQEKRGLEPGANTVLKIISPLLISILPKHRAVPRAGVESPVLRSFSGRAGSPYILSGRYQKTNMSILSTERLGHSYHDKWLFKDLHFALQRGERTALVGANGAGKSTLLGILSGAVDPSEGRVVREKGIRSGHLQQNPDFERFTTISDFIYSADHQQQQLIRRYEELVSDPLADADRVAELSDQLTAANAWDYEHAIKGILSRFQLTDLSQPIGTLSGGQRKRLALAKLLIDEPDVYILDEPTNHLDIETIEWLEKWLATGQKTVLLVTHDRYFLDNVCSSIYELEGGSLQRYTGNYSYYLEKRAERVAADETTLVKNRNLLRRELEWMRRQPQARGTKSKARIDAFHGLKEKTQQAGSQGSVQLSVKVSRLGGKILELEGVTKSYGGKTIIHDFSYVFKKGDRIGLAGRNGTGKSTFLDLVTDVTAPDSGTIAVGDTVVIGYYRQTGLSVDPGSRVIDVVKNIAEYITMANGDTLTATQLLTLFLFPPEKQFGLVSKLSGGERKRLLLMRVLMQNPNVLILDEPANDLDIDTLNVLEDFLANYPGILLLVSHDRYLLDRLTDQLFIFDGTGNIARYNGNYAAFKAEQKEAEQTAFKANLPKTGEKPAKQERKTKLTFAEQREYEVLDSTIPDLERRIAEQTAQLSKETDYQSIAVVAAAIDELSQQLDSKTQRWLVLSEYV